MGSVDYLETVDSWNSEYDNNFSIHNNDIVMMNESSRDLFDVDEDDRFTLLNYNT